MKERRLVLSIAVGEEYQKIAGYTHPTLKRYADRIGADFLVIDESNCSTPHWEKFQICQLLNHYDRIIYLDTDLIVRDDCPDLFEIVPKFKLGMFNEAQFTGGRTISMYETCKEYDVKLPDWDGKYYNTGVMVISARHNQLFKKPQKEAFNFYEQGYLNMMIAKQSIDMFELPYQFNRMSCMDRFTGEERHASHIIHYAGFPSIQFVQNLIPNDIAKWEADSPDYDYQRHILVDVQGGLGDQVCAEPAIRYMAENVYPGEDITVVTHFPRIFQHLGLSVFKHGEFTPKPDTPYYSMLSLPGPDKPMWAFVSNLLCHTIDYCAMAMIRQTLPVKDKRVQLTYSLDDISHAMEVTGIRNLNDLVLVHPGRHWDSKSFPADWWQSLIDGLHEAGLPVCLIGFDECEVVGLADIEAREGMIDTRDRLELGALIALIANAKIVISNDSSPIHIAGAFDNYIFLIPTCKHPDHLLPWRHGSQGYKTRCFYKRLACQEFDSRPTTVPGSSGEFLIGEWKEYLPDVGQIISETVRVV